MIDEQTALSEAPMSAADVGWRCRPCGWETFALADMHNLVNWPNPDGSIALVCPRCGTEGDFVDAERA